MHGEDALAKRPIGVGTQHRIGTTLCLDRSSVEWPEWHVDCAQEGCEESILVAGLGEAYTVREAEKAARIASDLHGWKRAGGLWYCPARWRTLVLPSGC
jgi:hypothetical protein